MPPASYLLGNQVFETGNLAPREIIYLPRGVSFRGRPGAILLGALPLPGLAWARFAAMVDLSNIADAARKRLGLTR
jgi:hypothetical protein